jgi:hypothetical protein
MSARYELRYNDLPFGEERFDLFVFDSNRYELTSQIVTDRPYFTNTSVRMALESSFRCDRIEYLNETSTGNNSLVFERGGDSLYVNGTLKGDIKLDERRSLDKDGFINPPRVGVSVSDVPVIASFLQLRGELLDLDVGDSLIIRNISHQVSLPYDFVKESVVIKRIPDFSGTQDDTPSRLREYSYDISLPHAAIHCDLAMDEEGTIVSLEVEQQIGILSIQLVTKE